MDRIGRARWSLIGWTFGAAVLSFPMCLSASAASEASGAQCRGSLAYFATLADGRAAGVYGARFDTRSGALCPLGRVAVVDKPTWVAAHPRRPVLYATSEAARAGEPGVFAYRIDRRSGALLPLGRAVSGGAGPTYLLADARSATLFVAHWGSGEASTIRLAPDGQLRDLVSLDAGEGRGPARMQSGPRSHAVLLDRSGRHAFVTDLGADRIRLFRFDAATHRLTRAEPAFVPAPPGAGPRHLVLGRDGRFVYVVNQLSSTVAVYRWDPVRVELDPLQTVTTLAPSHHGPNDAAAIIIARDGRTLYVTNRGEDSIVAYRVAHDGRLTELQRLPSGGRSPRAVAIDRSGRWLLAANQGSDEIRVFARDRADGRLSLTSTAIAVPAAAGVAWQ